MKEYVEKDAALACFHDWIDKHGDIHTADEMPEYQRIEVLPPADVAPVVHGVWITQGTKDRYGNQDYYCSVCKSGEKHSPYIIVHYCWNCGAKMEKVENE